MRKRFRQGLAGLLAVMTIATTLPLNPVYAAELPEQSVSDPVYRDNVNSDDVSDLDETEYPADMSESADSDQRQDSMEQEDTEAPADTAAPKDTEEAADAAAAEDSGQPPQEKTSEAEEAFINFVAVDAGRVEVGGTQNIVVDIGDDSQVITDAALGYHRVSDNSTYETVADRISGNGLRFTMHYTSQSQVGEYVLDYLNYTMDGRSYTVLFEITGMDIRYGVGMDVERTPDAEVVDEPENTVDMEVVTFDESGRQTSEQSIADAIASQQNNGVRRAKYNGNLIVVLDPGHDGVHAGASGNGLQEAAINLKIAQYCKEELERYYGVTVYMTVTSFDCPNGGYSVSSGRCNELRVEYAKSVGADVYVALHNNSNTNTAAHGVEIYRPNTHYRPDIHDTAKDLADDILAQLAALGLNNRGTFVRDCQDHTEEYMYPDGSQADYYAVIRNCKRAGIPALIVEHAFLSNASDAANFLNSDEKLKRLGVADATGIANYYGLSRLGNYDAVFDAVYYADHYQDLKAAYGYDERQLLAHFQQYGMAEGRRGSARFDVFSYRNAYADLRNAFGMDLKQYYLHYMQYGQYEKRIATGVNTIQNPATVYNGTDYAAVYDYNYYLNLYPDLRALFANDDIGALQHFVKYGMAEGRRAKESFDPISYYFAWRDLRAAFGEDWKRYYTHYMEYGIKEKRVATGVTRMQNPITVWNGIDYAAVYDYYYYLQQNPDVQRVLGVDDNKILQHFVTTGMAEARKSKASFDVLSYYYAHRDLRLTYGSDWKSYYMHYVNYGIHEKRVASGVTALQNPVTVWNGTDYAAVYDYNYYLLLNPDVNSAFGGDDSKVLQHFVNYGMNEGRVAKSTFIVSIYRDNYLDLKNAYGDNLKPYYMHYIQYGVKEQRNAATKLYHKIMGGPTTNVAQMVSFFNARASYPEFYRNSDAPTINELCQIFYEESVYEGVDPAVAFCQTILETGWLGFRGQVSIDQFNFSGLGATDDGAAGATFPSARIGIRAQVQHLKAYGSNALLNNAQVDPRFHLVTRNTAPYVEWLGQQENPKGYGWATGKDYGPKILKLMGQLYTF